MARDSRAYLFDILGAADRIERFIGQKSFAEYAADELVKAAVERQFEIIGEALNQLQRHDALLIVAIREHRKIIGFRNLLIHGYADVDDAIVWSIISQKLPPLLADVIALNAKLDDNADY